MAAAGGSSFRRVWVVLAVMAPPRAAATIDGEIFCVHGGIPRPIGYGRQLYCMVKPAQWAQREQRPQCTLRRTQRRGQASALDSVVSGHSHRCTALQHGVVGMSHH